MTIPSYGEKAYWEQRYKGADADTFEWYGDWSTVKPFLKRIGGKKDMNVLHIGCGNSTLAEEMHEDGYRNNQFCVDFVESVMKKMQKRSVESRPEIKYDTMDITDSAFKSHIDSSFQLVIDKGCLDTVVCGTDVNENVSTMLSNVWSCLAVNGTLLVFSYGPPEERLALLDGQATNKEPLFNVKVMVFKKPSLKVALEGGDYELSIQNYEEGQHYENSYFVYICRKLG
ncbi:methyltransferase [Chloropicon primus]|nr:methyltransferase [Chloropicon primus]